MSDSEDVDISLIGLYFMSNLNEMIDLMAGTMPAVVDGITVDEIDSIDFDDAQVLRGDSVVATIWIWTRPGGKEAYLAGVGAFKVRPVSVTLGFNPITMRCISIDPEPSGGRSGPPCARDSGRGIDPTSGA